MKRGARVQTRSLLCAVLGVLLVELSPPPALAEPTGGYILDPSGRDTTRVVEPNGMSGIRPSRRRSPTGFLYPYPLEPQTLKPLGEDWRGGLSLDVGGLGTWGNDDETRFWRYADWGSNFLLRSFRLGLLEDSNGLYANVQGGGVGRDDQFYLGEISWLGRARLRGSFNGIPRAYAHDARSLYQGIGSDTLNLVPGLTPGGEPTDELLIAKLGTVGESHLSVQRNEGLVRLDARVRPDTRVFARYRLLERNGERPFGGSWLYPTDLPTTARAVETIEPIDDWTHEISTGLALSLPRGFDANLLYTGSIYRNENESLTWDNPFLVSGFTDAAQRKQIERGRFALAPDNSAHNLKADLVVRLPLDGRLATTASWSRMRQDQDLLPPTVNSGMVGPLNLDDWNTGSALARSSADAEVETLLLRGDLLLRPWKRLRLGARVRYFDREDKSNYTACNPATGEAGYVTEDGALAALAPVGGHQFATSVCGGGAGASGQLSGGDFRFRATPYGHALLEAEGNLDARLDPKTRLGLRYAWVRKDYDHRERDHTIEQKLKLKLSSRRLRWATARISYEYAHRDGSRYDYDPYAAYYATSLPEFTGSRPPFTLAQFRKYDLADRRLQRAQLHANFLLREDMDLAVTGQFRDIDYGSDYGLQFDRGAGVSVEWNWQPSPNWNAYLMGSWDHARRETTSIAVGPILADADAGSPTYPLENAWELRSRQDTGFAGLGLRAQVFERWTLETRYSFIVTHQAIDYDYASTAALAAGVNETDAGTGFPALETLDHDLEASLRFQVAKHLALRVFYLFRQSEIDDFQQMGLDEPTLVNAMPDPYMDGSPGGAGTLFLGHVDRDYTVHAFGATLQLRY